jgi:hypothetical protein
VENAEKLSALQQTSGSGSLYEKRLAQAQRLRAAGFGPEADAAEAAALKFQPKVKGWEKVTQGGRVMFAPFFEDGTSGAPVPLDVAEKLQEINQGGSTALVNPFTGTPVQTFNRTMTPGEAASNVVARGNLDIARERLGMDRQNATVAAGKLEKEQVQRKLDANDVLSILDEAETLIPKSTSSYIGAGYDMAARAFGGAPEGANVAAQLKVLQGTLVSKMPKMTGPQSDKDVQLYREMAGQIGDPTLPVATRLAAAETLRNWNENLLGMKKNSSRKQAEPSTNMRAPLKGQLVDGYRFKGGAPSNPANWEKQ